MSPCFLRADSQRGAAWFQNQWNKGKRENLDNNLEAEKPEK